MSAPTPIPTPSPTHPAGSPWSLVDAATYLGVFTSSNAERSETVVEMPYIERLRRLIIGQLAFLRAMRANPFRLATTDDICSDLRARFSDGGKWRGWIPRDLAANGVIKKVGWKPSRRVCRHHGPVAIWKAIVTDDELDRLCESILECLRKY